VIIVSNKSESLRGTAKLSRSFKCFKASLYVFILASVIEPLLPILAPDLVPLLAEGPQ
jgi:hypothetical protein